MARSTTQITGTIEGANEKGLKVAGTWYNFSKHHAVPAVSKGTAVTLTVEDGKWINALSLNGYAAPQASQTPAPAQHTPPAPPAQSHAPAPGPKRSETFSPDSDEPDQRTQIRIAAISAAFGFQGSGYSKYEDPFELAEQIAGWINRA